MKAGAFGKYKNAKNEECIFQGTLEKNAPKGVGLSLTPKKLEFGVWGEEPFTVYRFYPEKAKLTIVPNTKKALRA